MDSEDELLLEPNLFHSLPAKLGRPTADQALAILIPPELQRVPGDELGFSLWHGAVKFIDKLTGTFTNTPFDDDFKQSLAFHTNHCNTMQLLCEIIPPQYQLIYEDATSNIDDKPVSVMVARWASAYIRDLIAARRPPEGPADDQANMQLRDELAAHIAEKAVEVAKIRDSAPSIDRQTTADIVVKDPNPKKTQTKASRRCVRRVRKAALEEAEARRATPTTAAGLSQPELGIFEIDQQLQDLLRVGISDMPTMQYPSRLIAFAEAKIKEMRDALTAITPWIEEKHSVNLKLLRTGLAVIRPDFPRVEREMWVPVPKPTAVRSLAVQVQKSIDRLEERVGDVKKIWVDTGAVNDEQLAAA